MILFRAVLDVEHHVSKKNSKQSFFNAKSGRSWVKRSDRAIKAQNDIEAQLSLQRNRQLHGETIHGDVQVTLIFAFKDFYTSKMMRNKRLPDLDNLFCLPLDALTNIGVLIDDQNVCSLDGSRRVPGDKNTLEIIIMDFKNETR